jgi:hypothetical protein
MKIFNMEKLEINLIHLKQIKRIIKDYNNLNDVCQDTLSEKSLQEDEVHGTCMNRFQVNQIALHK